MCIVPFEIHLKNTTDKCGIYLLLNFSSWIVNGNCLHVQIVLKSGSLNLLEPSGPVQSCNGTVLPFNFSLNRLTPNDQYMGRTAPLTSKRFILYIYSTNKGTEYFKHALYSPSFSLQNAVCFIVLTCLVPVLFTFYIQGLLKLKNNSGYKGLILSKAVQYSTRTP